MDLPAQILTFLGIALGLTFGSFLNVVIVRLPIQLQSSWQKECQDFLDIEHEDVPTRSLNIIFPRSHCVSCQESLSFFQNIPILSFLILRGRCANCAAFISPQYPLVEILGATATTIALLNFGITIPAASAVIFSYCLIILAFIDLREQLLPDQITIPLLWLGLIVNIGGIFTSLQAAVLGATFGYLGLWLIFWTFKLITGKEGMGYGDFKFLAALGAWLGWHMLPIILLVASSMALTAGMIGILSKRLNRSDAIAFGPYLALAGYLVLYLRESVFEVYLSLLNV